MTTDTSNTTELPRVYIDEDGNVDDDNLITLKQAAALAGVTTLTAKRRFDAVELAHVAVGETDKAGRPPRLYPRTEALEAVLNGVGNRRTQAEIVVQTATFADAPAAQEANAILAAAAELEAPPASTGEPEPTVEPVEAAPAAEPAQEAPQPAA